MAWAAWTAALVVIESTAIANKKTGDTLTDKTRSVFFTHTKLGRAAFGAAWSGFSIWFFGHILELWP